MGQLLRGWAILVVAGKRLWARRWLALATVLGLIASTALAIGLPLYANAVYHRVLRTELWGRPDLDQGDLPLALLYRYIGDWEDPVAWRDFAPADAYVRDAGVLRLTLPLQVVVSHLRSPFFGVYPPLGAGGTYEITDKPLVSLRFASLTDFVDHVTITQGAAPQPPASDPASPLDVVISEAVAGETGLQAGEVYNAYTRDLVDGRLDSVQIPVRIAGIWKPASPDAAYWFYTADQLSELMFVREESFPARLDPAMESVVDYAAWYLVLDGETLEARDIRALSRSVRSVHAKLDSFLPGVRLDRSPIDALRNYQRETRLLTVLLYAFSVPVFGLVLAFVMLVAHLVTSQQRNEIAVLRSRGSTIAQIVGIAVVEAVLMGAVALASGLPIGVQIAHLMGRARSFLDFSMAARLQVRPTATALLSGLAVAAVALFLQVVPASRAARHSIVTYKQETARVLRKPWWQRIGLDFILLAPAAYGGYLLRQQGSILSTEAAATGDVFSNPLLFLVPALAAFAVSLLVLRALPVVMGGVTWLLSLTRRVGLLMAARHLSRVPSFYTAPLLLLALTLSLSTFVASMAQTLDNHLHDQQYYRYGADMHLVEQGEAAERMLMGGGGDQRGDGPEWNFLPVSEHLKIDGVQAAARVGRYRATTSRQYDSQGATVLGVDRAALTNVAFWRGDFAGESFGAMMNALATKPNGVLVSRSFQGQYVFGTGDTLQLYVYAYGQRTDLNLQVVGFFDLFPTWYPGDPDQGPLFVTNLDYVFQEAGGQIPYNVWLATQDGVSYDRIASELNDLGLRVRYWYAPVLEIAEAQQRPQRQGLFGALSVGFAAAAVLTALGFLLYAFFSFRRRFVEFGVLRAIGLSPRKMVAFLGWELGFLVLIGLGVGTGTGVALTEFFIPFLQVGAAPTSRIPPYVVRISWAAVFQNYVLFGGLFVVALGLLIVLLLRIRIFQALKMGETV